MKVKCKVVKDTSQGGQPQLTAECLRCGHETTSFGVRDASKKRCLALLRDECPNQEENFYVDEDDDA
jgi:hypothetical protein